MKSIHKKILFFDGILVYLIAIFLFLPDGMQSIKNETSMVFSKIAQEVNKNVEKDEYKELPKKVALTFDDGPNPDYTPQMLEVLKDKNVKATFFLLGQEVEKYPDIVKQIYEDGHIIGNHSYKHEQLNGLSDEQACYQVQRTNQLIYDITGEYPQYFRPPFGIFKENLECQVNMIQVLWNVDPLDWSVQNHTKIVNKVVTKAKENAIILMHDGYATSVSAAIEIIDKLQKEGYDFVTVDEVILE